MLEAVRVYTLQPGRWREFNQGQFRKMADFSEQMEEWFGIQQQQQILLKDGQRVNLPPTALFYQLKLQPGNILLLLAKPKKQKARLQVRKKEIEKKNDPIIQRRVMDMLVNVQESVDRAWRQQRIRLMQVEAQKKLLWCMQGRAVDVMIAHFIKQLNIPRPLLLITNTPKLKFIIEKMTEHNPRLRRLLKSRINTVKAALFDHTLKYKDIVPSTVNQKQVQFLIKLGYSQEKAVTALEISKNRMETAIQLLESKAVQQRIQTNKVKHPPFRQYIIVFEWLEQASSAEIVLLHNCPAYTDIYLNSLKHTHPHIHQFMRKWRKLLPTILQQLYPRIDLRPCSAL